MDFYHSDLEAGRTEEAHPLVVKDVAQSQPNYTAQFYESARLGFVRKVLAIVVTQLCVMGAMAATFMMWEPANKLVKGTVELYIVAWVVGMTMMFVLFFSVEKCCPCYGWGRKYPWNYVLLAIFTLSEGYLVGVVCAFHDAAAVLLAVGLTIPIVAALTIYAWTTKTDFRPMIGVLIVLSLLFLLLSLSLLFVRTPLMTRIVGGAGCLLFSLFLIYDIQVIRKGDISVDDYVYAAMMIFVDIIGLFLNMLSLITGGK